MKHPRIIQGGLGVSISSWRLASAVSRNGQLGVVSGTAFNTVFARRLQDGDSGGHMRRALRHFPIPGVAERIIDRYYVPGGKKPGDPYKAVPLFTMNPSARVQELAVAANFADIWLAKQGHDGPVGINLLEKIQLSNIFSLYGAMLAGVDYVLMGAGIPREIPGVLDSLARHEETSLRIHVEGALPGEQYRVRFSPRTLAGGGPAPLRRPWFLAIIASNILAEHLVKKATGKVDGFVVEGPTAGGHNAPPRGTVPTFNEQGEPVYGPRDAVDLSRVKALGLPFWVAGSTADPEILKDLLAQGAAGIQVGTLMACCEESAMADEFKQALIRSARKGEGRVFTDPVGSSTGFPFKIGQLRGTISEKAIYESRPRICDLSFLRRPYRKENGTIGYRCPSEPVDDYVRKGGRLEDTVGRKCLCNALLANIGLAQHQRSGYIEKALITIGDDVNRIARVVPEGQTTYTAADVLRYLLGE